MITVGVINEELAIEPFQDRVLVLMDEYKSGRECSKCGGAGHLGEVCQFCKGTKLFKGEEDGGDCPDCQVGTSDLRRSLGYKLCDICSGNGTTSIIIPDDAQTPTTTGKVIGLGSLCGYIRIEGELIELPEKAKLKEGEKVIFTSFAGNEWELPDGKGKKIKVRMLKELEIIGKLHGISKVTPEDTAFKQLKEVGIG